MHLLITMFSIMRLYYDHMLYVALEGVYKTSSREFKQHGQSILPIPNTTGSVSIWKTMLCHNKTCLMNSAIHTLYMYSKTKILIKCNVVTS